MSTSAYTGNISQQTHTYQDSGEYTVRMDNSITSFYLSYSTTFNKLKALKYVETGSEVATLGTYAFKDAFNLISADFPGVKNSASYTFTNCHNLQEINAPQLTSVGTSPTYSLSGCYNLTAIYVDNSTLKSSDDGFGNDNTTVTTASGNTLKWACPSLKEYKNANITALTPYIFAGSDVSSVNIPNLVANGARNMASAFRQSRIISVEFSQLTGTTGTYTFEGCPNLQYVKLNNLTSFSTMVFGNCPKLKVVDFSGKTTTAIPTCVASTMSTFLNDSHVSVIIPDSIYGTWTANASWTANQNSGYIVMCKASDFDRDSFMQTIDTSIDYGHFQVSIQEFPELGTFRMDKIWNHHYRMNGVYDWDSYTWKNSVQEAVIPEYDEILFDKSIGKWIYRQYYDKDSTGNPILYMSHEFPTVDLFDLETHTVNERVDMEDQTISIRYVN